MLTPDIYGRIDEYINSELGPRSRQLSAAIRASQSRLAMQGGINSGAMWHEYARLCRDEMAVRANIIWAAVRRTYVSLDGKYTDSLVTALVETIDRYVDKEMQAVFAPAFQFASRQNAPNPAAATQFLQSEFKACREEWAAKLRVEVKFFADDLKHPPVTNPSHVMNFNAPIGAVQTGPYAVAHVSMGAHEQERLITALTELLRAIETNTEVTAEQRSQSTELVADLISAAKAERPNSGKLVGLLGGLAQTVQTVAALQGAWDLVRSAATAIGIHVP